MLSNQQVYERLAREFIALRLDWEQGHHYKDRFGFILGTGDQMILDPTGQVIQPDPPAKDAHRDVLFGRHGLDLTGEVLDGILERLPARNAASPDSLDLDWFFWSAKPTRRPGGFYPAGPKSIAGFARLPIATVHGPLPDPLRDHAFLRRHVRQFIWVRGQPGAASRLTIERVQDGLPEGLPTQLAAFDPAGMDAASLGRELDAAWLAYMKNRPLVAKGYLDNPHGGWMRSQRDRMLYEDEEVRRRARAGDLVPPGRSTTESDSDP